ncbi:MAG: ribonuclease R [Clostridia bacterium]|nr:ribonuclease R [Clostridia bacterium]
MNIRSQIDVNKLLGLEYDFVIAQLCVLNNKPYQDVKSALDDLITNGVYSIRDNVLVAGEVAGGKVAKKGRRQREEVKPDLVQEAYDMLARKDKKAKSKVIRVQGKIDMTKSGYAFLIPLDTNMEDIFIAERDLKGAKNNDIVIIEARNQAGKRMEGKVIHILERGQEKIVGKINLTKKCAYVSPDDVKFGNDIYIPLNKCLKANQGDKVVVKITKYYPNHKQCPDGEVIEVLGAPDKIETLVLGVMRNYDLYEEFPNAVKEYAASVSQEVDMHKYKDRLDLTKKVCFTIDGEDSRDLDDAISLEINKQGNRVLGVHIADVGEYVRLNSAIDKEAFKRGTSVYFPNLVLPMLPRELSNGICSLNENVNRLALSVFIEYDEKGNVLDYSIHESIINSKKRFTYTTVQAILEGNELAKKENAKFVDTLLQMDLLAKQLQSLRQKAGSINFNIPEVQIYLNDLGGVSHIEKRMQDASHKLIESFMVAANEVVAKRYVLKKMPFVYRIHEVPDGEKMNSFLSLARKFGVQTNVNPDKVPPKELQKILDQVKDKDCEYAVNKIALRSMQKAKYSPECLGHYGLALTYYSHFTSPIRRYPDLTIHRIIKAELRGEMQGATLAETRRFVTSSSMNSSAREVVAEKAERDVDDIFKAQYMSDKIGEVYEGIVSSVTKFGCYVALDNTVEGLVSLTDMQGTYQFDEENIMLKSTGDNMFIGKKVKVQVVNVNVPEGQVDFRFV